MSYSLLSAYADLTEDGSYVYGGAWTAYAEDFLDALFLWLAVAFVVVAAALALLMWFRNRGRFSSFVKTELGAAFGLGVCVAVTELSMRIADTVETGYSEMSGLLGLVLIPSCVLGGVVILGIIAAYAASFFGRKAFRVTTISALSAAGATLVAFLACLVVYYSRGYAEENNGAEISLTGNVVLYAGAVVLAAGIVALAFLFDRSKGGYTTRSVSYAAVCIALSFALSYVTIFRMPYGGSVTLASMLPLMIYGYMFGTKKGVVAGLVYGLLQSIQDPWIIHPAQYLLDYPVAFAAIGLAGAFAGWKRLEKAPQVKFVLGAVMACAVRYLCHVISGVFAFGSYAPSAGFESAWAYSLAYNSFVFVDVAIVLVAGVLALSSKSFNRLVERVRTESGGRRKAKDKDGDVSREKDGRDAAPETDG